MQVSSSEICRFIGRKNNRNGDREFFIVTLCDEEGQAMDFFADQSVFYSCDKVQFGDAVKPCFDIYKGKNGIGTRLRAVIPWEKSL